jgi:hypothetical protein
MIQKHCFWKPFFYLCKKSKATFMLPLNIQNETSRLRAVVLGTAVNNGPTPTAEEAYDPKSLEHILAGTYPVEADMINEMEAFNQVFKKYDVEVFRPDVIPNYNQIFSRDIGFVIDDVFIKANILPDREKELDAIQYVIDHIDPKKVVRPPEEVHIEGGDVMLWNDMNQTTNSILMIRPVAFRMNEQTAVNNYYQKVLENTTPSTVNAKAQNEFDAFVEKLRKVGVNVIVVEDTLDPDTPDSIFPNNWISFHENGDVTLYPMFAENRRAERREDILDILEDKGFAIHEIMDYTSAEEDGFFLEGTGSIVLDRDNGKAYCALSPRADEELFIEFCEDFDLAPVIFEAYQTVNGERKHMYHTNVMMCIAETFAVVCADCIDDKQERKMVLDNLKADGKDIILVTEDQVNNFAGNMLQVKGKDDKRYLVMSNSAYQSLTKAQIHKIEEHCEILHANLDTIEACGGGSARCMMAEVFLPVFMIYS